MNPEMIPTLERGVASTPVQTAAQLKYLKRGHCNGQRVQFNVGRLDPSAALIAASGQGKPGSYKEAMASPEADKWKVAIEAEHRAIVDNGTYHLVPLPPGHKPIKTRWMFKIKRKADGSVDCYKAMLRDVDFLLKLSIEECCVNFHLMDLKAIDECQCQ